MNWKQVQLKTLLSEPIKNGYSPICPEEANGKWILSLGALTDNGLDITQVKPAPINDYRVDSFLLKLGDFLVSRSNTLDKVGRSTLFHDELENCSYPDLMMKFRINEKILHPEFLEVFLKSHLALRYFRSHASGTSGSMVKINKTILEKLLVPVPEISEQKAIANLLSTWDVAIEKTERLIELKEKQFKWLLNEFIYKASVNYMVSGWAKVKLKELVKVPNKERLKSVEGKKLLTVKLHCLGIEENIRIVPILTERGRPYFERKSGEFLIGRQNFHNGGFGIVPENLDKGIASNAITSLKINDKKLDIWFLLFQLSNPNYYKRIGHIMDGTGQKELSENQILNLTVSLPDLNQQNRICEIHKTGQQEIGLLKTCLEKYKEQKRGLMQKLVTGEWRVKI